MYGGRAGRRIPFPRALTSFSDRGTLQMLLGLEDAMSLHTPDALGLGGCDITPLVASRDGKWANWLSTTTMMAGRRSTVIIIGYFGWSNCPSVRPWWAAPAPGEAGGSGRALSLHVRLKHIDTARARVCVEGGGRGVGGERQEGRWTPVSCSLRCSCVCCQNLTHQRLAQDRCAVRAA